MRPFVTIWQVMKWFHQTAQISCQRGLRKFRAKELCAKHVPFIVVSQEIIKVSAIGRRAPVDDRASRKVGGWERKPAGSVSAPVARGCIGPVWTLP